MILYLLTIPNMITIAIIFPNTILNKSYIMSNTVIKANLLSDVSGTKAWGHTQFDCCLEPLGHEFIANTRTEENWKHTQSLFNKIGGASLKVVSAIAEGVTTSLANKYLPEEISKFKP